MDYDRKRFAYCEVNKFLQKILLFTSLVLILHCFKKAIGLTYGVMAAQQILVLLV